ncbi:MAG TPA: FAD:protein FMN transferase [Acidimicrobiales bacterium]|nr:FAD:protein FMN transferase [Acidimicrobiales bacterium]
MALAADARLRAMGTDVHVVVVDAPPAVLPAVCQMVRRLDRRWSRFRPASDISRLNGAAGAPVVLPADTFDLVARAVAAWHATGGRFDPTVLGALVDAGYDRTFSAVRREAGPAVGTRGDLGRRTPGCGGIDLWPASRTVRLPRGVGIDPGGIGKGLAADLVVAEALRLGACGACVNLGGDVRVAGDAPSEEGWVVAVDDPGPPEREVARVRLAAGAVVTTTPVLRSWRRRGQSYHHLIDPATGTPAVTGIRSVTVVGGEASWAEVFAKAAYLAGPSRALGVLESAGLTGLVVTDQGDLVAGAGMEAFVACTTI